LRIQKQVAPQSLLANQHDQYTLVVEDKELCNHYKNGY